MTAEPTRKFWSAVRAIVVAVLAGSVVSAVALACWGGPVP